MLTLLSLLHSHLLVLSHVMCIYVCVYFCMHTYIHSLDSAYGENMGVVILSLTYLLTVICKFRLPSFSDSILFSVTG